MQDIQLVHDATANGAHAMLKKQLGSCGCKTWQRTCVNNGCSVVDIYAYTSDRGPEQGKVRTIMAAETLHDDTTLFVDWDCTMHATQLVIKSGLVIVEACWKSSGRSGGYFSGTACDRLSATRLYTTRRLPGTPRTH